MYWIRDVLWLCIQDSRRVLGGAVGTPGTKGTGIRQQNTYRILMLLASYFDYTVICGLLASGPITVHARGPVRLQVARIRQVGTPDAFAEIDANGCHAFVYVDGVDLQQSNTLLEI